MVKKVTIFALFISIFSAGVLYGQNCLYLSTEAEQPPATSTALTNKLENDWGYTVDYKDITQWGTPIINPENYDFMIIDEIISSSDAGPVGTDWPIPLLNMEGWASDVFGVTAADEELDSKNIATQPITIEDESHPVAGGLTGSVDIIGEQGDEMMIQFKISESATGVVGIAKAADAGNWVVAAVDSGGTLVPADDGSPRTAPARMVTLGVHNNGIASLTDDGFTLIKAAIDWMLEPPGATAIDDELGNNPMAYKLNQNYPNPFNPTTEISFTLQEREPATLKVYNSLGQLVTTLVDNQTMSAGTHRVTFNGAGLPTGVYFYRLQSGNYSEVNKMVLMK